MELDVECVIFDSLCLLAVTRPSTFITVYREHITQEVMSAVISVTMFGMKCAGCGQLRRLFLSQ